MLERKMNALRNLVLVLLLLLVGMAAMMLSQGRQINRNHDTLKEMQKQAETAMGQFTPELDARLSKFEKHIDQVQGQMNGLEGRIKVAEDQFLQRINREMPQMLDRYMDKKMREISKNPQAAAAAAQAAQQMQQQQPR